MRADHSGSSPGLQQVFACFLVIFNAPGQRGARLQHKRYFSGIFPASPPLNQPKCLAAVKIRRYNAAIPPLASRTEVVRSALAFVAESKAVKRVGV
jgi:hypothetical protein